jgi:hypothetical protein
LQFRVQGSGFRVQVKGLGFKGLERERGGEKRKGKDSLEAHPGRGERKAREKREERNAE